MIILLCANISEVNPYIQLLSSAYQKAGHTVIIGIDNFFYSNFLPDFVHIHWPEALLKWKDITDEADLIAFKSRISMLKQNKIPIVATYHNEKPHEYDSQFYNSIYEILYSNAEVIVHHGKRSIDLIKSKIPKSRNAQHIVCPHGPYPSEFFDPETARRIFGIPPGRFVLMNFGLQRSYKGHNFIKLVFKKWKKKAYLFTIGSDISSKTYDNQMHRIVIALQRKWNHFSNRIFPTSIKNKSTIVKGVPHNEIPMIMACSDVMFLGHTSGLNSGLLSLAASYRMPVVYPDIGNFNEQLNGWPWREPYEVNNAVSAIKALDRMWERITAHLPEKPIYDNKHWLQTNSWEKHVQIITESISLHQ